MAVLKIFAGASGFSYKAWKGPFYPEKIADADMLGFYARQLPCVEINNTFYRMPKSSVMATWAENTPRGFRFAIKASRRITHMKRLKEPEEPLAYLYKALEELGPKAGPVLYQLPPNFKKDLERLTGFLAHLPKGARAAFEFRHESWFDDEVYEALKKAKVALVVAETNDSSVARSLGLPPVRAATRSRCRAGCRNPAQLAEKLEFPDSRHSRT